MQIVKVDLGDRSYPIVIGDGILADADLIGRHIPGRQVVIVSNETVAPMYAPRLKDALGDRQIIEVTLPDGEKFKTMQTLMQVFDAMLEAPCDRDATVVALGGGVVGDMAGFAAGCYQRGVSYVQIPTTLLSQVDSSVGGKTAVNHPAGKNMIGMFYQPVSVLTDISTLATLPDREFSAGMAEVIKYGAINDIGFFEWLEANADAIADRDPAALIEIVDRSCQNKADVVARDEREQGVRAILNFGHTFGHAIEGATDYSEWLHGEAVGCGMVMAAAMSERLGWISQEARARLTQLVEAFCIPVVPPAAMTPADFLAFMARDKKVANRVIRLILLRNLGQAELVDTYPDDVLDATLAAFTG